MPSAPTIPVFELFEDKSPQNLGVLFKPEEVYAMATALSYIEDTLEYLSHPDAQMLVKKYTELFIKAPAETAQTYDEIFAWYCQCCSEVAELTGQAAWKASPKDFTPGAARFLTCLLQSGLPVDKETVPNMRILVLLHDGLLAREEEVQAKATPPKDGPLRRVMSAVVRLVFGSYVGKRPYLTKFDLETCRQARAGLQKLVNYYNMATQESRVFTFDEPKENIAQTLELGAEVGGTVLGSARISTTHDGRVIIG